MVKTQIAPEDIFEHAGRFYQALAVLRAVPLEKHVVVTLAEPLAVLSALTTELFLKMSHLH